MSIVDEHALWQERISAYLDGELGAEEEQELMDHLDECEKCRSAMLLLRSMGEALQADTVEPPAMLAEGTRFLFEKERAQKKFSPKRWRFTAIAAVICLALLGVATLAPRSGSAVKNAAAEADHRYMSGSGASLAAGGTLTMADSTETETMAEETAAEGQLRSYNSTASARPADTPVPAPQATSAAASAPQAAGSAYDGGAAAEAGVNESAEEPGAEAEDGTRKGAQYSVSGQPGYAVYQTLEDPSRYYSVCFVYGEVPQTIRDHTGCVPLDAPEGQERWLVPLDVCLNEGLLEQFQEIYYGDLLSQQGLVIGILDMEEEKWLP